MASAQKADAGTSLMTDFAIMTMTGLVASSQAAASPMPSLPARRPTRKVAHTSAPAPIGATRNCAQ